MDLCGYSSDGSDVLATSSVADGVVASASEASGASVAWSFPSETPSEHEDEGGIFCDSGSPTESTVAAVPEATAVSWALCHGAAAFFRRCKTASVDKRAQVLISSAVARVAQLPRGVRRTILSVLRKEDGIPQTTRTKRGLDVETAAALFGLPPTRVQRVYDAVRAEGPQLKAEESADDNAKQEEDNSIDKHRLRIIVGSAAEGASDRAVERSLLRNSLLLPEFAHSHYGRWYIAEARAWAAITVQAFDAVDFNQSLPGLGRDVYCYRQR